MVGGQPPREPPGEVGVAVHGVFASSCGLEVECESVDQGLAHPGTGGRVWRVLAVVTITTMPNESTGGDRPLLSNSILCEHP